MKGISQVQSDTSRPPQPSWQLRRVVLEVVVVTLGLMVIVYGSFSARQHLSPFDARLTTNNDDTPINIAGMYPVEEVDAEGLRWSSEYAFVQLPFAYHAAPQYIVSVRARADNPHGTYPLKFFVNEHELVAVIPDRSFRTYHLLLPETPSGHTELRFGIETTPFVPAINPRTLGVMLTMIQFQPVPYHDWRVALLLALGFVLVWGWLRWLGSTFAATALITAVGTTLLLILYAQYQPAPLRYSWLAVLAMVASMAGMCIAHETVARLGLMFLVTLVTFSGTLWPSWISDDAFISFRYAQNLVRGHGLVYNIGERVEGYTNFLWTVLAALVLALGRDPVFWSYVAGVILALGILLLTYWLARRLLEPAWALLAALIVATSQSLLVYTARGAGLETGLFTLLALSSSAWYLSGTSTHRSTVTEAAGLGFAVTTLTRPEGILLMGLTLGHILMSGLQPATTYDSLWTTHGRIRISIHPHMLIRHLAFILGAYMVVFVPYFLWRISYYGELLPNTFYAKTGGGVEQALRGMKYTSKFVLAFGGPLLLLIFVPLFRQGWAALKGWQGYLLLLVGTYSGYIILVGGDHFPGERFFVPLVPWCALLMTSGLATVYASCQQHPALRQLAPVGLTLFLLLYPPYALQRSVTFDTVLSGNDESVWIWRELGWWLQEHTAPDASVAALGAGAIAYYSDRTTIDLLGLNERHIARVAVTDMGTGTAGHEKRDPEYVLRERRPMYIPQMWEGYFGGAYVLRQQYTLIQIQTRYGRELALWERLP